MAYSKLYKVIRDHALGYQSVNQAADNEQEIQDDWSAEHGTSDISSGRTAANWRWEDFGRHNLPFIPRAIVLVTPKTHEYLDGTMGVTVTFSVVSANGLVSSVRRDGDGLYFFSLVNEWDNSWVEVTPTYESVSNTPRQCTGRIIADSDTERAGVAITLFERTSGVWGPKDYEFSVALFGVDTTEVP